MAAEFPSIFGNYKFEKWFRIICSSMDKNDYQAILAPFFLEESFRDYADLFIHLNEEALQPDDHVAPTALHTHYGIKNFWSH